MQPQVLRDQVSSLEYIKIDHGSKELICLLHGYGANMYDLSGLAQIDVEKKYNWIFINAPIALQMGGMNANAWFPIDMQALEIAMQNGGHRVFANHYPLELENSRQVCLKFFDTILQDYEALHLGGFSQGAMLSSHLLRAGISKLKTLTLLSANLIGADEFDDEFGKVPFFQSHGHGDQVLAYDQAKALFELLKLNGLNGEFISFNGGHEIPESVLQKWWAFLTKA